MNDADPKEPSAEAEELERPPGAPDPAEELRQGKDPGYPLPGFPGPPGPKDSPTSDADAPAPG